MAMLSSHAVDPTPPRAGSAFIVSFQTPRGTTFYVDSTSPLLFVMNPLHALRMTQDEAGSLAAHLAGKGYVVKVEKW